MSEIDKQKQAILSAIEAADISQDDWTCDILNMVTHQRTRGYLCAKVDVLTDSLSSSSEDFRGEMRGVFSDVFRHGEWK